MDDNRYKFKESPDIEDNSSHLKHRDSIRVKTVKIALVGTLIPPLKPFNVSDELEEHQECYIRAVDVL
jgi:hypothetical protein